MLDTNDVRNIGQVADARPAPRAASTSSSTTTRTRATSSPGNFVQKSASSTAEILHPLFSALGVTIDYPIALALYTAIVYDTGSFIYPKTTALTFGIARDLVERGVEPNVVYANVYESNSISALVLHARVLATLELALGNHVALLTMRREMIAESGGHLRGGRPAHQHPAQERGHPGVGLLQGEPRRPDALLDALEGRHRRGGDRAALRRRRPPHRGGLQVPRNRSRRPAARCSRCSRSTSHEDGGSPPPAALAALLLAGCPEPDARPGDAPLVVPEVSRARSPPPPADPRARTARCPASSRPSIVPTGRWPS